MSFSLPIKRTFDFLSSLIGVLIISPILLTIAIGIKLDSDGPVFFKQKRLGKGGEEFNIIKFRTMVVNAEKIGDGLSIKSNNDKRITKIGSFLRKTSLDELPQLFNVIKGEMSLIGPRPPVTYHPYDGYANYPDWAKKRFEMKPGVTGLSQIRVRNSVSWDERIKIDLIYIEEFSLKLDMTILFNTISQVLKSENIY